jgi:hypothetical protein
MKAGHAVVMINLRRAPALHVMSTNPTAVMRSLAKDVGFLAMKADPAGNTINRKKNTEPQEMIINHGEAGPTNRSTKGMNGKNAPLQGERSLSL